MRTNVSFRHPAEFIGQDEDNGGILAIRGVQWFTDILSHIEGLELDRLCQEDWGVVYLARRNQKKFWIGLSFWESGAWLAHFHHNSFAILQRLLPSGDEELERLLVDTHAILTGDLGISQVVWYEESEMSKPLPQSFATPM